MRLKFPFPVSKFPRNIFGFFTPTTSLRNSKNTDWEWKIKSAVLVATKTKNSAESPSYSSASEAIPKWWCSLTQFRRVWYWKHLSLADWRWWVASWVSASKFCHHKSIIRARRDFSRWLFQLISIFQIKLYFCDENKKINRETESHPSRNCAEKNSALMQIRRQKRTSLLPVDRKLSFLLQFLDLWQNVSWRNIYETSRAATESAKIFFSVRRGSKVFYVSFRTERLVNYRRW